MSRAARPRPTDHHRENARMLTQPYSRPPPTGLRHVQEEEDQVRRQAARLHPLHQLQDGLRLHPGREEEEPAQRVSARHHLRRGPVRPCLVWHDDSPSLITHRAKYIEGLENRLGRMESLLRLSGMVLLFFSLTYPSYRHLYHPRPLTHTLSPFIPSDLCIRTIRSWLPFPVLSIA